MLFWKKERNQQLEEAFMRTHYPWVSFLLICKSAHLLLSLLLLNSLTANEKVIGILAVYIGSQLKAKPHVPHAEGCGGKTAWSLEPWDLILSQMSFRFLPFETRKFMPACLHQPPGIIGEAGGTGAGGEHCHTPSHPQYHLLPIPLYIAQDHGCVHTSKVASCPLFSWTITSTLA